ncbi:MAG TPA: 23S rRNA (adenine(2030)-N(6))-methyltransferase RlmJ [Steroidobacteraceae bacterium]|nr:23S rRNA (adenine(2030)-N(6))-methyltransferase RlmJ [Steroidobacteraceae bacterium]
MNYAHAFHAGNFADVHKHLVLLELLNHLQKKPTPFFLLETHAGRGLYDLHSDEAKRGDEWRAGISRILALDAAQLSTALERYVAAVRTTPPNTASTLQFYPGSPLLAVQQLRATDRAVFVEKHTVEAAALQQALNGIKRVTVTQTDGYSAMNAHLPPKENRGLVMIDPPYESDTEFADVARALQGALQRWRNGVFCVWHPLKSGDAHLRLHRMLVDLGIRKILKLELYVRPKDSPWGLNGSGLLVVNPPWQFDEQMRELQPVLHRAMASDGAGDSRVEWLVGE